MVTLTPQIQKLDFDPTTQLEPITNFGTGAQAIAIKKSLPATNLAEFLAYAKANPGKLNFTTAGSQNLSQFSPVRLFAAADVNVVMVPARAEPQAITDLLSGIADIYFGNASAVLPLTTNDSVRVIAVSTPKRLVAFPDLPTVAETVPGFESSSWNGFLAPKGTPAPIIEAIRKEITTFVNTPEISAKLNNLGIVPGGMTKDDIETAFHLEHDQYAAAIKVVGVPTND
jgi:tripartite-type tricarboxylate transporter receptor subunit TctC